MDKKVPAVPSLAGIQDLAVRDALQTLIDGWSLRNGHGRDQGAQFVTRDSIENFLSKGQWGSNIVSGGVNGLGAPAKLVGTNGITGYFQNIVSGIIDDIKKSALWKDLSKRIDAADATATSAGLLGQEALLVVTEADGTIKGAWTVKFDADGYVVGAGLGIEGKDGSYTSQFLVRADRFALGSPSTEDLFPFIVDSHNGQSVIALNGQVYIGATPASEIGAYTSYVFKESATQPATPTDTTPIPAGWLDSPSGTHTNPIWMSKATITASTGLAGTWSAPVKVTGQDGSAGKYTAYQYAKNTSLTTQPTTGWQSTPYALATGEYQWMRSGQVVPPATEPVAWGAAYRVTGEKGTDGLSVKGDPGTRGSVTAYTSGSAWSNTLANSAIASVTGTNYRVMGDTVIISNGTNFADTKYWSGTAWVDPGVVIDGNLLVTGSLSADKIYGGTMAGASLNISDASGGWVLQANYGSSSGCLMYRPSASLLKCSNMLNPAEAACEASGVGREVMVSKGTGSDSTNHGFRGQNTNKGTSGLVGVANGYDFYADGATSSNYGPFTGAHDALIGLDDEVEAGEIVVDVDCLHRRGVSNTICQVAKSTFANQRGAVGVVCRFNGLMGDSYMPAVFDANSMMIDDFGDAFNEHTPVYERLKDSFNYILINGLGEGQVFVCGENGPLEVGDLIVTSSMPGKGMKQADDVIRSYTVAKAREAVTFASPDEVKLVACIYLCG